MRYFQKLCNRVQDASKLLIRTKKFTDFAKEIDAIPKNGIYPGKLKISISEGEYAITFRTMKPV